MQETASREKILKNIRIALSQESPDLYPDISFTNTIYAYSDEPLDLMFAQNVTHAGGKFMFCENAEQGIAWLRSLMTEKGWTEIYCMDGAIKNLLSKNEIPFSDDDDFPTEINGCITTCEYLIARTGSALLTSLQSSGRRLPAFAETHIILGYTSQLVRDIADALVKIEAKYSDHLPSFITMITGPSRTADIEKTLITGAHGPKELYVLLMNDIPENG